MWAGKRMSFVQRSVAHCDICGHEWLTKIVPKWCAKCKGRKWNQDHQLSESALKCLQVVQDSLLHAPMVLHTKDGLRHHLSCKCGVCAAQKESSK